MFFFLVTGGSRAATIASSKTFFNCKSAQNTISSRHSSARRTKARTHSLLRQCRALDVLDRSQLARKSLSRLGRHGPLLLPRELLEHGRVVAEIDLGTDDEARDAGAVVVNLGGVGGGRLACMWCGSCRGGRTGERRVGEREAGKGRTYLGEPLLLDVLERSRACHAEADEEDVRLRVRERPETIVILLSSGIEESERVGVVADHDRYCLWAERRGQPGR